MRSKEVPERTQHTTATAAAITIWGRTEAVKQNLLQANRRGGHADARTVVKEVDQRKARTVVIRIVDEEEKRNLADKTPEQIARALQGSKNTATKSVTSARIMKSGDILVTKSSIKAREDLERSGLGANDLVHSAKVLRNTI